MKTNTFSHELSGEGMKFALVVARFNEEITTRLEEGARNALKEAGVREEDIEVAKVPGSFEIPLAAHLIAEKGEVDAIICLGAILSGETPHATFISQSVCDGIRDVGLKYKLPVTLGVLTDLSHDQAYARSQDNESNAGFAAATSAIEMIKVMKKINNQETIIKE